MMPDLSTFFLKSRLYQVIQKLKFLPEKSPKVPAVSSDKEVDGKITVRKGGGTKKTDCLPIKYNLKQDLKPLARTPK
jgi:hypothetical protein